MMSVIYTQLRERIREDLLANPALTNRGLAEKHGVSADFVQRIATELRTAGLITRRLGRPQKDVARG